MTDINTVIVVGRLTKDFELKYTNTGLPIGTSSIAVNRSIKNKNGGYNEDVSFFNFKILGKTAETLKQYLLKGKQVAIEGYLKQDSWKDNDGTSHSATYIGVNNIELLGGKTQQEQTTQPNNQQYEEYPSFEGTPF